MGSVLVREGLKGSAKACVEAGCGSLDRGLGSGAGERVDTFARLPVRGGARGERARVGAITPKDGERAANRDTRPSASASRAISMLWPKREGKTWASTTRQSVGSGHGDAGLGPDLGRVVVRPLMLRDHAGADERRLVRVPGVLDEGGRLGRGLAVGDLEQAHLRVRQPACPDQKATAQHAGDAVRSGARQARARGGARLPSRARADGMPALLKASARASRARMSAITRAAISGWPAR